MDRNISPPPTKRRKFSPKQDDPKPQLSPRSSDESLIRIYSWNINGIKPFLQNQITSYFTPRSPKEDIAQTSLRDFLRRHNWPQMLCLQEIKLAPGDEKTQKAVKAAVNNSNDGPKYDVFFTLPKDKFNGRGFSGKVYGVCSVIRSDFYTSQVKTVRDVLWDLEGRISIIESITPEGEKFAIWNIYAVNGTTNNWRDSRTGEVLGTRHERKLFVHNNLMEECKKMEKEGWKILIIGDLNVAPQRIDGFPNLRTWPEQHTTNRADFSHKFLDAENDEGLQGVDVWRHLRGEERKYTYHPRSVKWGSSCDRVDLAIASKALIEDGNIAGAEIWDSEQERGPSDHIPISVDINFTS